MADEYVYESQPAGAGDRVGFCQDCGRPLTAATIRTVGSGVFCEPCLERRVAGAGFGGTSAGASAYAGPTAGGGAPPVAGASVPVGSNPFGPGYPPPNGVFPPIDGSTPHPLLAGFLGLIPGVGAMYNGQFAKGFVHLIVFAVLVSLSDNVNGVFGLLVAGWIFFMSFEAYHTAKARRDGLPLPDPFGLNNVGERFGFKNWTGPARPAGTPWVPGAQAGQPPYHAAQNPDWVGYVPPADISAAAPVSMGAPMPRAAEMPVPPPPAGAYPPAYDSRDDAQETAASVYAQAAHNAGYSPAPYAQTYTGVPLATDRNAANPVVPARRFPVGAMWLIGLGLLFLLGNLNPAMRYSWPWMIPVLLAAVAIWLFVRRLDAANNNGQAFSRIVCGLRAPVLLLTLAVLCALQAAHRLTLGQTWPVLFIAFGALLVLERTVGRMNDVPVPVAYPVVAGAGSAYPPNSPVNAANDAVSQAPEGGQSQ